MNKNTQPLGTVFITTSILAGYVYQSINNAQPVVIGANRGITRYYLHGLIPQLSCKYQVVVFNKVSFEVGSSKLVKKTLEGELKNCHHAPSYCDGVNTNDITAIIDQIVLHEEGFNGDRPYVYVDIERPASIEEMLKDHRMMGIPNAGMKINSGVGFSQTDYNLIMNMTSYPEALLTGYKIESKPVFSS